MGVGGTCRGGEASRGGCGVRFVLPPGVGFYSRIDGCDFFHVPCSPLALAERCGVVHAGGSYIIWRGVEVGGGIAEGEAF